MHINEARGILQEERREVRRRVDNSDGRVGLSTVIVGVFAFIALPPRPVFKWWSVLGTLASLFNFKREVNEAYWFRAYHASASDSDDSDDSDSSE